MKMGEEKKPTNDILSPSLKQICYKSHNVSLLQLDGFILPVYRFIIIILFSVMLGVNEGKGSKEKYLIPGFSTTTI